MTINQFSEIKDEQGFLLIVDDDADNLDLLSQMMADEGYRINTADSGNQALEAVVRNPPDLILLDVNMPDLNGYEVCRELKKNSNTSEIPVIFLSALSSMSNKLEGFRVGGVDFITKPFQLEEILARVSVHTNLNKLRCKLAEEIEERKKAELELQTTAWNLASRVKALACLHGISRLMEQSNLTMDEVFQQTVDLIIQSLPYPEKIAAQITYGEESFRTHNFKHADLMQISRITLNNKPAGMIEVSYLESQPDGREELFFEEGRELIYTISKHLGGVLERREMELEVLKAKEAAETANRFKSEFIASMSHELRNHMHHILGYAHLGVDKIPGLNIEKIIHYFKQISLSGDKLLLTLNRLIDLSNLESGRISFEFTANNVFKIISEVVLELSAITAEKNQTILLTNPETDASVMCDGDKIGQVVRNLLINAINFTPHFKQITFNFSNATIDMEEKSQPGLKVSISDQGIGIPAEEFNAVFSGQIPGRPSKNGTKSTGLGLAICKKIVEEHQGIIWAENHPAGGAVVNFILPRQQPTANSFKSDQQDFDCFEG